MVYGECAFSPNRRTYPKVNRRADSIDEIRNGSPGSATEEAKKRSNLILDGGRKGRPPRWNHRERSIFHPCQ